jgi:hypothetical protein
MKHLKKFNESEESPYDVILSESGYNIVIGYRKDIVAKKTGLLDGYFSATAYIGDDIDFSQDDYSSPFHKGQVIPKDFDEDFDVEEVDFRYHESINKSIVKKLLEDYITNNYDGKLVKIIYH